MLRPPVIAVVGSTATGKTDFAISLCKALLPRVAEIINLDALQVYKGFDLVTNKADEAKREGIPHHLFGHIPFDDATYGNREYVQEARQVIRELVQEGRIPVLVGGSHGYYKALLFGHSKRSKSDVQPVEGDDERINGIFEDYRHVILWAVKSRNRLRDAIANRAEKLFAQGLVEEAARLKGLLGPERGSDTLRGIGRAIGYKELLPFLNNEAGESRCTAIKRLVNGTWVFSKKQKQLLLNQIGEVLRPRASEGSFELCVVDGEADFDFPQFASRFEAQGSHSIFGGALKAFHTNSDVAMELRTAFFNKHLDDLEARHCSICGINVAGHKEWNEHLNGRKHRRKVAKSKREEGRAKSAPVHEVDPP